MRPSLARSLLRSSSAGKFLRPAPARVLTPQLPRNYATAIGGVASPVTEITTLPSGLTVATEEWKGAKTATVGVWIDAGSRAENEKNNGVAHFLEHMAFKGTSTRPQTSLELLVENLGGHLNAYTSREQTVYYAKSFSKDVPTMLELISDILQNSKLEEGSIERERDVILREMEEVEKQMEEVVFDHLHATAFQGQPLGQTILGPRANIMSITRADLQEYIKTHYTSDRMVLVGTGGISHQELVSLASKHFSNLPVSPNPIKLGSSSHKKTEFVGSEIRIRDDLAPTANIALAVEGVGWNHPDHFPLLVLQSVFGNWDRSLSASPYLSSSLSHQIATNQLANSFMSFSTSYSDTGLFGIYLVTQAFTALDEVVHTTLKEWQRAGMGSLKDSEVERAKRMLKAGLLLGGGGEGGGGTTGVAEEIGRQIVTTGRRWTVEEIERRVDEVTPKDVELAARKYLWDRDLAIAATGRIEGMLDYVRIRSDMSSLRF
ncbi:mitochondrial processing peptidase beta subunit [Atractiella rhizophila]|nr:mitochondrial processing peptidase beta subunit [Atractiella rhizophila]